MTPSKNKILRPTVLIISLSLVMILSGCGSWMTIFGHQSPRDSFLENTYQLTIEDLDNFKAGLKPINGEIKAKYLLARHFQRLNRHLNAIEELNEVIKMEPYFPEAYNSLGVSYDSLGRYAMAEECYKMALRLNPDLAYVVNNLGYSYMMRGEYEKARQFLEMAVAMEENNIKYRNNLLLASQGAENAGHKSNQESALNSTEPEETLEKIVEPEPLTVAAVTATAIPADIGTVEKKLEESIVAETIIADQDHYVSAGFETQNTGSMNAENPQSPETFQSSKIITKDDQNNGARFYKISPSALIENDGSGKEDTAITVAAVKDETTSGETADNEIKKQVPQVSANLVEIELVNGNGVRGFAQKTGNYLREKGYRVRNLKNADHFNYKETKIFFHKNVKEDARQLSEQLPGDLVISHVNMIYHHEKYIRVLLGKDLAIPDSGRVDHGYQIEISNGNGVNGAARRMSEYLRGKGFPVNRLSNADHFNHEVTRIFFGKNQLSYAQAVLEALPDGHQANMVEMDQDAKKIRLLIGKDVAVR